MLNEYFRCRTCGKRFEAEQIDMTCPNCGSRYLTFEDDEDDYIVDDFDIEEEEEDEGL